MLPGELDTMATPIGVAGAADASGAGETVSAAIVVVGAVTAPAIVRSAITWEKRIIFTGRLKDIGTVRTPGHELRWWLKISGRLLPFAVSRAKPSPLNS
jgi:hypothetical protein